jgi:hypothetical protein
VCVYFVKIWHASRRICMARDVARQVCINAQFYPSFLLAACKCGEKYVRLWLAITYTNSDQPAARVALLARGHNLIVIPTRSKNFFPVI